MAHLAVVLDGLLIDVVARRCPEKGEREVLAHGGQVAHGVVHQPRRDQHQAHQRNDLDGVGPVASVMQQHAQGERLRPSIAVG
ncbi:hypothetical protein D9M68_989130 [compost metagenome]